MKEVILHFDLYYVFANEIEVIRNCDHTYDSTKQNKKTRGRCFCLGWILITVKIIKDKSSVPPV